METLLAKFRIDFEEVIMVTDINKKADTSMQMEFDEVIEGMNVSDEELQLERDKTNRYELTMKMSKVWLLACILYRYIDYQCIMFLFINFIQRHLRLAESVRAYSSESEMVVMTLPLPKRGSTSPALYMSWLDVMTKDMPPVLLIRGNQQSVLTFYS